MRNSLQVPFLHLRVISIMLLLLLVSSMAAAWGGDTHRFINRESVRHLPTSLSVFISNSQYLYDHASDADSRKGSDPTEGPKHYIDLEDYPEYLAGWLPRSLDSLISKYGQTTVTDIGILPWATLKTLDSLTLTLKSGDYPKALQFAADLGHYVADAAQPLHVTSNYDGASTGNNGIHSRYESKMMSTYLSQISVTTDHALYLSNPSDAVFNLILDCHRYVDTIMAGDNYAKSQSGWNGSGTAPGTYYAALWTFTGPITQRLIQKATVTYASFLYTAAVNANIVTSIREEGTILTEHSTITAYPNPFNPTTILQVAFPFRKKSESCSLTIIDAIGREVAVFLDLPSAGGMSRIQWNAAGFPSGVYYAVLRGDDRVLPCKLLLVR